MFLVSGVEVYVSKEKDFHSIISMAITSLKKLQELDFSRNPINDTNIVHIQDMVCKIIVFYSYFLLFNNKK